MRCFHFKKSDFQLLFHKWEELDASLKSAFLQSNSYPLKWTLSLPINHIAHRAYFTNIYWALTICQVCFKVFHTTSSPKTKPYKIGSYYNNLTNTETEAYRSYTTCLRLQNQQVTKPRFKPRQKTPRCLSTPYLGIWADNFQSYMLFLGDLILSQGFKY